MITRSNIPSLLIEYLHSVFSNFNIYDELWKDVYRSYKSDKAVEYEMEMQSLGIAQLKQDGGSVAMGDMRQAYQSVYLMQYFGLGFPITRATIMDNQYESEFPRQAEALKNSLQTAKNINGMFLFNHGFDALSTGSDGQPLFSLNHPVQGYSLANTFSNGVGLNEAAVEQAINTIRGWRSASGLPIKTNPLKFLVPQAREWDVVRILKTPGRLATADNDISAIVHNKMFPQGYTVNQFITNPNFWCILTDEPNGFKYFLREELDIDFITDVMTDNTSVRAIERYAFGFSNWRAGFASGVGINPVTL
jgi:hypothetical protein